MSNNKYNEYRGKRNLYLFLLVFPTVVLIGSIIVTYFLDILEENLVLTLIFIALVGLMVLLFILQPKIAFVRMKMDYYYLISFGSTEHEVRREIYDTKWIQKMIRMGYKLAYEQKGNTVLYKYYKKLEDTGKSDNTLVLINIAFDDKYDFYSDETDKMIQSIYVNNKDFQKITRQITLQFRKHDVYDDFVKSEVETMIAFHLKAQTILNLTTVYLEDNQSVVSPIPKDKYPNRYVYFAANEIRRIVDLKE